MNTPDISSIGAIPRKATVPVDHPRTTIPRPASVAAWQRFSSRVPAALRSDAAAG